MVKNTFKCLQTVIFGLLFAAVLLFSGCGGQGETAREVNLRHNYIMYGNLRQIQEDLDAVFLLDKPGTLSDRYQR